MDPFKIEDNLANVCFAGLDTRSIPHGNLRQNSTELAAERVEVRAFGFYEASPQMVQNANGGWVRSHWAGQISWEVITQRAGNNAANHNVWVSAIRTDMSRPAQFFNRTNLPCYDILRVTPSAAEPDENPATDADRTRLQYDIELNFVGSQVP